MKGYWSRITRLSRGTGQIAASLLFLGACGTGKFSEDFSMEIQQDCIETVSCNNAGQIESCIGSVGEVLNSAGTPTQQWFVDAVYRCQGQKMCEWVKCVQSTNQSGYAALHLAEITHDCQQRTICQGSGDNEAAVRQCIQETGNRLNADLIAQSAFDSRFARCSALQGCDYGACQ